MNEDSQRRNTSDSETLRQALSDVEIALLTAVEHSEVIENELLNANDKMISEIRERVVAERRLAKVLEAVSRKNEDLELLMQNIIEHSDDSDVRWLERYSEVETLSFTDSLTQLGNRRRFETVLDQEIARCRREGSEISLLMCDVDFFKQYNDRYGHPAGDQALKDIAKILETTCKRPGDCATRIGGEEFALLLANTDHDGALAIAEKIRTTLFDKDIEHLNSSFGRLTLCVGVATLKPDSTMDAVGLIASADSFLYKAKQAGRNCSCSDVKIIDPNTSPVVEHIGGLISIHETKVMESLVLSFSPSLFSLQQRWRNNGLSADFLADYVTTFFPGNGDEADIEIRKAEFKGAIGYIANELLENGMKHSLNNMPYPITMRLILEAEQILFIASNTVNLEAAEMYKGVVKELTERDPMELYIEILENSDSGTSGLGLITMMNDYGATLAWEFEQTSEETCKVSTKVKIEV